MTQHAVSQTPGTVPLQEIFITHELERRPQRPPDYQAENRCLVVLARELAHAPESILQRVTEMAMELCHAESTGLSLLEDYEGQAVFRWRALAGPFAVNLGGMTQRNFSPCGIVVDCRQAQLFSFPGRYYPYLNGVEPPIVEVLLLPFFVAGEARGTIWVMAHDGQRKFDAEDVRILSSLAEFTGAAYQVNVEIVERRRAEKALRESEQYWRTLAEALPVLVWMARPDGFLDYHNQRWYDYTGLTAEQLAGWGWQAVWHPEDLPEGHAYWLESLRTGQPYEYEARFRRAADGSFRWHLIRAVPLRDQEGRVLRWFGTTTDIEEQKHTAAELQRINDELQQFAHIVSHDLNEPLRTVSSFVQLLAKRYQGNLDTDADEFIEFTVDGIKRMQALIHDLLAYTRVGGQAQTFTAVDCETVLTRVLGDLHLAIRDSAATVTRDPLPTIPGDATQLGLVFQNLIGNALKFRGPESPHIHVSARRAGKQWVFAVRDNGISIDPQQAERIFQVFQRLHPRKAYPGTGMGLAICKKIVERHGGRIWVESAPDQGCTFFFTISGRG